MENKSAKARNMIIKKWSQKTLLDIHGNVQSMFKPYIRGPKGMGDAGIKSMIIRKAPEKPLIKSLSKRLKSNEMPGVFDQISFGFERHGLFLIKGVGKSGKGERAPKDWLNPVLERNMPELADKIGENTADEAMEVMIRSIK